MAELPAPVPAATLVLMRAAAGGAPELLMMERTGTMAFAAGALVFPGGRIDPQDVAAAALLGAAGEDGPARIAAIRETIEETGLVAGLTPSPSAESAARLRTAIEAGEPFGPLLEAHGFALDPDALVPFARWCPNFAEARRFDTYFFLAEVPADTPDPEVAPHEGERAFWATAQDVLTEIEAGGAHAIFPTRRNLERLACFGSIDEARADAARHPVRTITPWVEQRGGGAFLCIPDDAGYPVTAEPLETARRS
jgi:8-oxo-dGTP pyrophosphatase MutT (NUDIX family)